jgi:pimeloyl-ACP methyl ester carboxylesterase
MSDGASAVGETRLCHNAEDGTAIRLHLRGSGPVLLMLHGWTLDRRSFAAQAPLAERFRLVTFDRRGCGESSAEPRLAAEIGDLRAVIEALDAGPVHLLGVSQGARLALRFAVAEPARLRSLTVQGVVLDGFAAADDDAPLPLEHYRRLVQDGHIEQMRREWLQHPMMNSEDLAPEQRRQLDAMVDGYSGADLLDPLALAAEATATPEALGALELPILIITGERESRGRRAHATELALRAPGAREAVLAGCGHLSNLGCAEAYNRVLREFLSGQA